MAARAVPWPSRRAFIAAAALAAMLPVAVRAADTSPKAALAFLDAIYDRYRNDGPGVMIGDRAALGRYFTPELAGIIAEDDARAAVVGEVPNLDADPFIDAQDGEIRDIAVAVAEAPGGRMAGHVTFTNSGAPKAIDLELAETADGWRIDDIRWPEGTLRSLYRR